MHEKQALERAARPCLSARIPVRQPGIPDHLPHRSGEAGRRCPSPRTGSARSAVKYEFIHARSNGFGDYTESGQVMPVSVLAGRLRIACS
jgi:hypothetical protein